MASLSSFAFQPLTSFILSIHILPTIFVILHIIKYIHLGFLYIIIRHWLYWEYPYSAVVPIFSWLYVYVWFLHKLYPATVYIFAGINNLKKMNINSVRIGLSQCSILCPIDILIP